MVKIWQILGHSPNLPNFLIVKVFLYTVKESQKKLYATFAAHVNYQSQKMLSKIHGDGMVLCSNNV